MAGQAAPPPSPGARRRPPSQADVAAVAGVSAQTVSRVANGRSNVDRETRERVLSTMRILGYQRNSAARALALGRFHMLGVVTFDLSAHGNARTLSAISSAAQTKGYSVHVACVEQQTEDAVKEAFSKLTDQAVDGVVVIEAQILDSQGLHLPPGIPAVVADGDPARTHSSVDTNQTAGATAATEHLLDLGHRTVWHVGGPQDSYSARRRAAAWHSTLKKRGAAVPPLRLGDWTAESGYRIGRELAGKPDITAVFAANDHMALGIMRALHEAGRRVPEDISVVGFDDVPESAYYLPPLTTVRQNFEEVGRSCVSLLLDQIEADGTPGRSVSVPPQLTVRTSSGVRH